MQDHIDAVARSAALGRRHIAEQDGRIRRQRARMAEFEQQGPEIPLPQARIFLQALLAFRRQMEADHIGAQQRLAALANNQSKNQ